jgi:hypothetical protein
MTIIRYSSPDISNELARSREQVNFAARSLTSHFQADFAAARSSALHRAPVRVSSNWLSLPSRPLFRTHRNSCLGLQSP